jgi:homospermidine synthase
VCDRIPGAGVNAVRGADQTCVLLSRHARHAYTFGATQQVEVLATLFPTLARKAAAQVVIPFLHLHVQQIGVSCEQSH